MAQVDFNSEKRETVFRELKLFRENNEWIMFNTERLRVKYPNKYIAVRDKEVIAASSSFNELLRKLKPCGEAKDIAIDYISARRMKFLL